MSSQRAQSNTGANITVQLVGFDRVAPINCRNLLQDCYKTISPSAEVSFKHSRPGSSRRGCAGPPCPKASCHCNSRCAYSGQPCTRLQWHVHIEPQVRWSLPSTHAPRSFNNRIHSRAASGSAPQTRETEGLGPPQPRIATRPQSPALWELFFEFVSRPGPQPTTLRAATVIRWCLCSSPSHFRHPEATHL